MILRYILLTSAIILLTFSTSFAETGKANNSSLKVRGDWNYPPFEFIENGEAKGFNVDLMKAISRVMGLEIDLELYNWKKVTEELAAGQIDIITGMNYSKDRDKIYDFCKINLKVFPSIFVRKESTIKSLSDLKNREVIVQNGDIMHDYALKHLGNSKLIVVESHLEAVKLLSSGKHDCALLAKMQGMYFATRAGIDNIRTIDISISPLLYSPAVREGNNYLLDILNEGLQILKVTGEYDKIRERWLGVYKKELTFLEILKYAAWILIPLLVVLVIVIYFSYLLKKQVQKKTADLRAGLEAYESAVHALHESELKYRTLFNTTTDAIFLLNTDGIILDCNDSACKLMRSSKENLLGWDGRTLVCMDEVERLKETVGGSILGKEQYFQLESKRPDGTTFPAEFTSRIIEIENERLLLFYTRDITDRIKAESDKHELEAQLRQQQKLESLGTLASGVAHEINNPINIVMNYAELIKDASAGNDSAIDYADQIISESNRIATIVRDLLAFSRHEEDVREKVSIHEIIESTLSLIRKILYKHHIELQLDLLEDLPFVSCHKQQIMQVMMNLLTNAKDALNQRYPEYDKNKIIRIEASVIEENDVKYMLTTVEDHGSGISDDIIERIFDPFFTSKPRTEGTGLGLSVSHGIMKEHNGFLKVESVEGSYTRFSMLLPL